jgi:hypothetical protein
MKMLARTSLLTLGVTALAWSSSARAEGFWSEYNLGLTYDISVNRAQISYNAPLQGQLPDQCVQQGTGMRCTAYLQQQNGGFPLSLFLEKPFKRQGLFFFEPGFTFATISYSGGIVPKPSSNPLASSSSQQGSSSSKPVAGPGPTTPPDQPLTRAYIEMYGINWQGYLRVGITPRYLPDLFLTVGAGLQTVGGTLKILQEENVRWVIQPEVFAEISAALIRVGDGALSLYVGTDQSLSTAIGTQLVEDNPEGTQMTSFRLALYSSSAGVRILCPF